MTPRKRKCYCIDKICQQVNGENLLDSIAILLKLIPVIKTTYSALLSITVLLIRKKRFFLQLRGAVGRFD